MPTSTKTLASRITEISKELGAIAKTGKNDQQHYDFIEYAVVSGKMRELLQKHGVAIIPAVSGFEKEVITSGNNRTGFHYVLTMHFTAINADDPTDRIESDWLGEASDYGDKGVNKAETAGTKYFYMRLFNISEKGEQEADQFTPEPMKMVAPAGHNPELDFETIKEHLDMLDDMESVKSYYEELRKHSQTPAQQKAINAFFNRKKRELEGKK